MTFSLFLKAIGDSSRTRSQLFKGIFEASGPGKWGLVLSVPSVDLDE